MAIERDYNLKHAAELLDMSRVTVWRRVVSGEIEATDVRPKGSDKPIYRISESAIVAYRRKRKVVLPELVTR